MLRIPVLILVFPIRLLVFAYHRVRAWHRPLLIDLHIKSDYSEAPLSHGIWAYFKPAKDRFYLLALELHQVLKGIQQKKLKASRLRITFAQHSLGWAQAWELRQLISQITAAGIETYAYLLSDDKLSLFMASACQKVVSPESATFDLSPFTTESLFVQSLLTKMGIRPQFLSVGEFKSAAEIFTRNGMSPAARKQTEQLIGDIETAFFSALAEKNPHLGEKKLRRLTTAHEAVSLGLLTATGSVSEFHTLTEHDKKLPATDLIAAHQIVQRKNFRLLNFRRLKRIALFVAEGNIVETAQSRPGTINWPDYETLASEIRDGHFTGVLVRINSPGGSATVSQLLWREWMLACGKIAPPQAQDTPNEGEKTSSAKKTKNEERHVPVFVSQGNVAASGGYYLSAVAEKIFSTPVSITGSIGVVGGKFNVAPLLNKWGVTIDRAPKKNPAPVFSPFADFAGEEKKILSRNMEEIYEQFLRDVALGRNTDVSKIRPHASGRVFSGKTAQKQGLTDAEGGLCATFEALRQAIGAREDEPVRVDVLPAVRESLFGRGLVPFGLRSIMHYADFSKPGIYALDPRFLL